MVARSEDLARYAALSDEEFTAKIRRLVLSEGGIDEINRIIATRDDLAQLLDDMDTFLARLLEAMAKVRDEVAAAPRLQ